MFYPQVNKDTILDMIWIRQDTEPRIPSYKFVSISRRESRGHGISQSLVYSSDLGPQALYFNINWSLGFI